MRAPFYSDITVFHSYDSNVDPTMNMFLIVFTPQPLRLWGIVITRGGRSEIQAIHLIYIYFLFFLRGGGHQAISGHFPRWPPLVGTITYEPLVGLHSNLVWLFSSTSDDLITFWDESTKNKMAAAAI